MSQGLEGVVAASSRLSHVVADAGRLKIAGSAVEDLAPRASYEDVAYLLLYGRLPTSAERLAFARQRVERRQLLPIVTDVLREAAAVNAPPIDALRMAAPMLSLGRAEDPEDDSITAIASFPTIVGT